MIEAAAPPGQIGTLRFSSLKFVTYQTCASSQLVAGYRRTLDITTVVWREEEGADGVSLRRILGRARVLSGDPGGGWGGGDVCPQHLLKPQPRQEAHHRRHRHEASLAAIEHLPSASYDFEEIEASISMRSMTRTFPCPSTRPTRR